MNVRLVFNQIGKLLVIIGLSMLVPLAFSLLDHDYTAEAFGIGCVVSIASGIILLYGCRTEQNMLLIRDGFALVTFGWLISSIFGTIPMVLSGVFPHVFDAFFETLSGFTATGITVFDDLEVLPRSILIWRTMSQWLGGMGIVVLFVAVLSGLGTGGMQLFKAEITGPLKEKLRPRISDTAKSLWFIYVGLTVLNIVVLYLCGMDWFDAINHGMATISTGGYSTRNANLGAFSSPLIEWVTTLFMFLSGFSFAMYYSAWRKKSLDCITKNSEVRLYVGLIIIATIAIMLDLVHQDMYGFFDALRVALFHVVGLITTTGFITDDYERWSYFSQAILLFLIFTGACAGSTSGGIKLQRLLILFKQTKNELQHILHPRVVTSLKINGVVIPNRIITNVSVYIFLYFCLLILGTVCASSFNIPFMEAFTTSLTCLGNGGPSFGAFGPTESFSQLPNAVKVLDCVLMLVGRLEIYTVLVVIVPIGLKRNQKKYRSRGGL